MTPSAVSLGTMFCNSALMAVRKKMAFHLKNKIRFSRRFRAEPGFTLIELILATAISALVIGILSVCLSFALRAWEDSRDRKPDQSAALVDLLKHQLAEADPTPIKFEEGAHLYFSGQAKSIAFATAHSVKAISRGIPVIARYLSDPKSKVVYYAEIPLNPYDPRTITEFVKMEPSTNPKSAIRFYTVELADFNLSYGGKEGSQFSEKWEQRDEVPVSVLMKWRTPDSGDFSQLLSVNSPFSIEITPKPSTGPVGQR